MHLCRAVRRSRRCLASIARPGVNEVYVPDPTSRPTLTPPTSPAAAVTSRDAVDASHWSEKPWSAAEIAEATKEHVMFTWGAQTPSLAWAPVITHGEGIYLYDADGKQYIDWTSQAVCSNLGHTIPPAVRDAVVKQMDEVPFVYGGLGIAPVRARLSKLLAEVCPGDINGFLFPSSGAEANEAAIRAARRFTGRQKILSRYRSYHGGTASTLTMTGDPRRWAAETNVGGFVHLMDPTPFNFAWGADESEIVDRSLAAMEETMMYEGTHTIAAVFLESIPGSGGVLIPPEGYIQGVRALCDKHDILLILDEVMLGFGRTGKMFGFQNFEGVLPDLVTFAKGISGAYLPLSGVGMRQEIKEFFQTQPLGWGSTYNAHPTALACGYEVMKHILDNDIVARAKALEPVMADRMSSIVAKHNSVRQARCVGLFGCFDLQGADGRMVQQLHEPMPERVQAFKREMLDRGIYGLFRPPLLHCAPPLTITEDELHDAFDRIDGALDVLDF